MRSSLVVLALVLAPALGAAPASGQGCDQTALSVLISGPEVGPRLGLTKLSPAEIAAWTSVLYQACMMGVTGQPVMPPSNPAPVGLVADAVTVFEATVEETSGSVVMLSNDAVVEVSGYLGYVGFRRDAVLFGSGNRWRLWIEGKRDYNVTVLREPTRTTGEQGERVQITEIIGRGSIVKLLDGRLLEVDPIDEIYTGIWVGFADAVLVGGVRFEGALLGPSLINLSNGDKVRITRVR